jgi:amidase
LKTPGFGDAFTLLWASGAFGVYQLAARATGGRPEDNGALEPFTIALADMFRETSEEAFAAAVALVQEVEADMDDWFEAYDAWLTPVVAGPTPAHGFIDGATPVEALTERLTRHVAFTPIHNACGTPACAIPMGRGPEGLPVGVQIAAGKGREGALLKLAYALEESDPWADKLPGLAA